MKENSIENLQNKKHFNNIDEAIKVYEEFRRFKNDGFIESIDTDFFFNLTDIILSDYKRVLKENEILKEEKEQAWEEWNNLEQGSYETEQKLKQQIKKLQEENEELKNQEATARRINELLVQRYSNSIPTQKVKDKIEELKQYKLSLLKEDYVEKQKNFKSQNVLVCSAIRDISASGKIEILQELLEGSEKNV